MARYGSYQSEQGVEILAGSEDAYNESIFTLTLDCTAPGCKATWTDPPEGAEFEFVEASIGTVSLTQVQFCDLLGEEVAAFLFERACDEARETGDF